MGAPRAERGEGSMRFTYYLYVYSWKILFIDDWRVVATDPPFAFVRCVRAHTGGAREGRARSRAAGEMHGGSLQTRGGDWFGSLPLGTKSVLLLNVCLYVLCVLFGYDAFHEVCMAPHWVLHQLQVYRILTAPLFHGGIIHLAFNMTAFVPMASSLERLLGSVQFLHIVFLFVALSSCFHVALAVIAGAFGFNAMHECAIGFSGVVFGVIVVDTHLQMVPRRSVFGFFQVPSQYYPVSLLLFLQVIIPSVSFLGHLAGLLAGSAYVSGYLNPLLLRQTTVAALGKRARGGDREEPVLRRRRRLRRRLARRRRRRVPRHLRRRRRRRGAHRRRAERRGRAGEQVVADAHVRAEGRAGLAGGVRERKGVGRRGRRRSRRRRRGRSRTPPPPPPPPRRLAREPAPPARASRRVGRPSLPLLLRWDGMTMRRTPRWSPWRRRRSPR